MAKASEKLIRKLLEKAGITVNGSNPWDPVIYNKKFYDRVIRHGSLGLGEAYMDGWWTVARLDEFITRVLTADLPAQIRGNWRDLALFLKAWFLNLQNRRRAWTVGKKHYDIGNDLYQAMLDPYLTYSCGYWAKADNLNQAQADKLELICHKLGLKGGETLLDIGGGWGSFARYAAKNYDVAVEVITVSEEQFKLGRKLSEGLPVYFHLVDYHSLDSHFGLYDHIVSVGMIEHVGYKNYREYMEIAVRHLKENGLFLLHTIGGSKSVKSNDSWIEKYIFPNSMLPSLKQLAKAAEGIFVIEDIHNFGADYDKTLMAWHHNFANRWKDLPMGYDRRFFLMWEYYLLSCAGAFRARKNQLWQIVLSKKGVPGGYQPLR